MSDTLRDQLLGLGFKPVPAPEKPRRPPASRPDSQARAVPAGDAKRTGVRRVQQADPRPPQAPRPPRGAPRSREDIDLAKAYAIRAQREKDERIEAERRKQEQSRLRREAKAAVAALVKDRVLNDPAADIARHFEYGGKIKRIHLTAPQLAAVNAGELGVLQLDGRYLLVDAALLDEAAALLPPVVALKVDPSAASPDDPYADPRFQVPDDLVW